MSQWLLHSCVYYASTGVFSKRGRLMLTAQVILSSWWFGVCNRHSLIGVNMNYKDPYTFHHYHNSKYVPFFSDLFYPWCFLFHGLEQSANWLLATVWVHIYCNPRPLLFPYKVDDQVHYQKFCHWEDFLFHCYLSGPPLQSIIPIGPIFELSSAFLLQHLVIKDPLLPCGHRFELREKQLHGWHEEPLLYTAYLGPLPMFMPDPRYITSFSSFLRWQITLFTLDISSFLYIHLMLWLFL